MYQYITSVRLDFNVCRLFEASSMRKVLSVERLETSLSKSSFYCAWPLASNWRNLPSVLLYPARRYFCPPLSTRFVQLTFVDFLEALARLAVMIPIPSDEALHRLNVRDAKDKQWLHYPACSARVARGAFNCVARVLLFSLVVMKLLEWIMGIYDSAHI